MTSETPEPGNGDVDDLGLTYDDWEAIVRDHRISMPQPDATHCRRITDSGH